MVDAQVAADADQPRLEVRAPVEGVERFEQLQKDVLREVFREIVTADKLVRDVEDLAPVQADDLVPCRLVAVEAPLDDVVDRGNARVDARMITSECS